MEVNAGPRPLGRSHGFSMLELLVAMAIMAVCMSGLVVLIPFATQSNTLNRWDTAGIVYSQRLLEQMRLRPITVDSFTDQDSNTIDMSAGGCPLQNGNIDWSQAVANCNGRVVDFSESGNPQAPRIQVRWNVQVNATNGGKLVTISGRQVAGGGVGRGVQIPGNLKLFIAR